MELEDIKFIIDLTYLRDVNRYLQKGWVLLKVYASSYDRDISKDDLIMHYVLGATEETDYSKELANLTAYDHLSFNKPLDATELSKYLDEQDIPF